MVTCGECKYWSPFGEYGACDMIDGIDVDSPLAYVSAGDGCGMLISKAAFGCALGIPTIYPQ